MQAKIEVVFVKPKPWDDSPAESERSELASEAARIAPRTGVMTDAKEWIIQRCMQRSRPAKCVGGFELFYEDFDAEPVTRERMKAKLESLSNSDDEFRGHNVANCRCPGHEHFK